MSRGKSIILEFMAKNPEDTFKLLLSLKLKLDKDKHWNSHFEVVIKIWLKMKYFHMNYLQNYHLKRIEFYVRKLSKDISEKSFLIDTSILKEDHIKRLHKKV